jgi:hypothetical protein
MSTQDEVNSILPELESSAHRFNRYERVQIREARQKLEDDEYSTEEELGELRELYERIS